MSDLYEGYGSGLDSPAYNAASVTPNNSTDLATFSRSLFIGGAGDVKVDMVGDGSEVTFSGVPAGTILPIRASRVYATDTTATNIVALW